eukprot:scaffold2103_cov185-Amphora_coffeaeformis.AAC.41
MMQKEETSRTASSVSDSSSPPSTAAPPLVECEARRIGPRCPFGNDRIVFALRPGGCVCLTGASGRGKTSLALSVAGLQNVKQLQAKLDMRVTCTWDGQISCGVLIQQTTLVDELTVASNLGLALQKQEPHLDRATQAARIGELLTLVGLQAVRDGAKRPHQLSGGMARRASLALQLAQHKRVIVLDEPFTGLDEESAESVASALVDLRIKHNTALLLISHQPHLVQKVMDPALTKENQTIHLEEAPKQKSEHDVTSWRVHGISWSDRFAERLWDYFVYSLPLIALAFLAAGMALAMLTADVLKRLDVTDPVIQLVDTEVRPMIKMLTGEEPNAFTMFGVRMKVRGMLNATVPVAKARLYAMGMTRLLVLEIGPLLTALLLCGRIGGSYAGRVATLGATKQDALLTTLGVSAVSWTLGPSLGATALAGPGLTVVGTVVALLCAAWMGSAYGLLSLGEFYRQAIDTTFPVLRLRFAESFVKILASAKTVATCMTVDEQSSNVESQEDEDATCIERVAALGWGHLEWDFRPTFNDSYLDAAIEFTTHPAIYHLIKAMVLGLGIVLVADQCARRPLTPRLVPLVITAAVVLDGLWVLLADWAFSQLWLRRHPTDAEWSFQSS